MRFSLKADDGAGKFKSAHTHTHTHCFLLGAFNAALFLAGYWPLGFTWCNVYVTCDVLACSSSILHMCFISLGRYMGIRNPLGSRHRSTKRLAGIKIAIVWAMAMLVSSSITVLGKHNPCPLLPAPSSIFHSLHPLASPCRPGEREEYYATSECVRHQQSRVLCLRLPGGLLHSHADDGLHVRADHTPAAQEGPLRSRASGKRTLSQVSGLPIASGKCN